MAACLSARLRAGAPHQRPGAGLCDRGTITRLHGSLVYTMVHARVRIIPHFVMRRVVRVHVPEFAVRTMADPVTNASCVILWRCRDETALAMVFVMRSRRMLAMSAMIRQQCMQKGELRSISLYRRAVGRRDANPNHACETDNK